VVPESSTPFGKSKSKKGSKAEVDDGMDEVDRALAELGMKVGPSSGSATQTSATATASTSTLGFRQLLSVDPKNLDADAELRRFFGSKVVSSLYTYNAHCRSLHRPPDPSPTAPRHLPSFATPSRNQNQRIHPRHRWPASECGN
jgi:hypothetical protein